MLGYMRPDVPELKVNDYHSFRSYYCGVCKSMQRAGGRLSCLALSYDTTLLALVASLYGADAGEAPCRCVANPLRKVMARQGAGAGYAADVNLLYAHLKCKDDVADEGSLRGRLGERVLRGGARRVVQRHPRLGERTEEEMALLVRWEKEGCDQPDLPASSSGRMLAEAFGALPGAAPGDVEALRWMGLHIGRFVYFCDAVEDAEEDASAGRYNVFLRCYGSVEGMREFRPHVEMLLYHSIEEAEKALSLLPERPQKEIIHNIIVSHSARLAAALLDGESSKDWEKRRGGL